MNQRKQLLISQRERHYKKSCGTKSFSSDKSDLDLLMIYSTKWASPVALVVKNPTISAGNLTDTGSIPGSGRSPGRHCNQCQYSYLENPHGGAWWATVHGVTKSQTRLKRLSTHTFHQLILFGAVSVS